MSQYRDDLPQLNGQLLLTDGGLETTLVFHEGIDLPCFAAFDLLKTDEGQEILRRYYERHIEIARDRGLGFLLEAPTWRANPDWAGQLGYDSGGLEEANRRAIELMQELRVRHETAACPVVISGNLGPRGDGYVPGDLMSAGEAQRYHSEQIRTFAETDADLVTALTLSYVDEAVGIVRAAREHEMPVAISFTVEIDGRLPTGETLAEAIERTDLATDGYAAYYMINCAHPSHFRAELERNGAWRKRILGLRANASKLSHEELDACTELDAGDPEQLGHEYRELGRVLPALSVVGGCCGTDHRHIEQIAGHFGSRQAA